MNRQPDQSPLSILYVMRDPPGFGGSERRLVEIGRRLVDNGHNVHVFCGKTRAGLPDKVIISGIHFQYISLLPEWFFRFKQTAFYLSRYLFYLLSIFWGKRLRAVNPDIIVDYVTPSPSMVYFLAKWHKIPCVAEIMEYRDRKHWSEVADPVTAVLGTISQNVLFRNFRYAKIITASQATRHQLQQYGRFLPESICVIPCAVDIPALHPPYPLEPRQANTVIIIGRLMPQKGHHLLLEALQVAQAIIPDIHLTIVGEGPLGTRLQAQADKLALTGHVTFTGWVSEAQKKQLLYQSALFAMPSLQEGFGIALLEAMACGLPFVAFDLPVYHEITNRQGGAFAPKGDSDAFGHQIVRLLQNDRLRASLSVANQQRARHFSWDEAAIATETLLLAQNHLKKQKRLPYDWSPHQP